MGHRTDFMQMTHILRTLLLVCGLFTERCRQHSFTLSRDERNKMRPINRPMSDLISHLLSFKIFFGEILENGIKYLEICLELILDRIKCPGTLLFQFLNNGPSFFKKYINCKEIVSFCVFYISKN